MRWAEGLPLASAQPASWNSGGMNHHSAPGVLSFCDQQPQRHDLGGIEVSEQDCSELCNTFTDGTVITIKQLRPA